MLGKMKPKRRKTPRDLEVDNRRHYAMIQIPLQGMNPKRSQECRNGLHEECDGTVLRGFDEPHDSECLDSLT
jgi:hypothetical protein